MMKSDWNSSHSWWWNSHNAPRQPGWLQSALGEIDEKTKAMLKLIEEDADSFAQRAEMYYRKRPELISLVEEFYRAYRALAERYDHLNGEIRQGIPKVLQVQYGISYETPVEFPFGNQNLPCKQGNRGFHMLLGRQGSYGSDSEVSEVDDPESEANRMHNVKSFRPDSEGLSALSSSESEAENPSQQFAENRRGASGRKMQATVSYMLEEKPRLLKQSSAESLQLELLMDETNNLKRERNSMKEEMSLTVREKGLLEKELDKFKTENKILRKQNEDIMQRMQTLGKSVDNLQAEHISLTKQNKIISTVLGFVSGQAAGLARSNARMRKEMCQGNQQCRASLQILKDEKAKIENMFEAEVRKVSKLNLTVHELQGEVYRLWEENLQKNVAVIGQNGEKTEAIRRFCAVDDPEPEGDRKNNINGSDMGCDDVGALSSDESEVDDPPQEVAENKRIDSRMREMQATISTLQEDKAGLLKRLSAKRLQSKHLKDEINNLNKQRNFMKEELSLVVQANAVLEKELQEFRAEQDKIPRNQNEDLMQRMQAAGKDAFSTILGFVGGRAATLERSNERWMNELCICNRERKSILQISKAAKKNLENMSEADIRRVSELKLILTIDELQGEVSRLREENRQQKISLVDQNEEKREAIRQLCLAMDVLRDNNQRLQEAVRSSRGGSQFSRWKKFLYAALDCTNPQS